MTSQDVALCEQIKLLNRNRAFGYLNFYGILPLDLPEGSRIVALPDIHVPAQEKTIIWAIKEFLMDFNPHIIIDVGDIADVFSLSRWTPAPRIVSNLAAEMEQTRLLIDDLISVSGCHHFFLIMGNHEDRIERYLKNIAPHVANLYSFRNREPVLSFNQMLGYGSGDSLTYIFDEVAQGGFGGGLLVNGHVLFIHGRKVRQKPGASPLAEANQRGLSIVHGHTHRAGMSFREVTNQDINLIEAYELGHLANPQHPYMAYANLTNNWHPAFATGIVFNGRLHLQMVPIIPSLDSEGRLRYAFPYAGKTYWSPDF